MATLSDPETRLRETLAELVTNAHRFTRLTSSITAGDKPRAWLRALSILDEHGELRISEFARIDRCSQPTATALLRQLTNSGLADRRRDPDDSRAVVVEMTEAGRRWLGEARREIGATLAAYVRDMDIQQIEQLSQGLADLRSVIKSSSHTTER